MNTCDILVVGGGIAGIGAAAMASEAASVTVLETEGAYGYHASGRSTAIFAPNFGNATFRALNAASATFLRNPAGLADAPLLSPRGDLRIATEAQAPMLAAYARRAPGIERLTAREACALFPILRQDRIAAACHDPSAQDIDVHGLLQGFARKLTGNGGRIEIGARARRIAHDGAGWQVETPQGVFCAPILVNAAGAWADEIAHLAGIPVAGLRPMRRSAVVLPAPDGTDPSRWPILHDAEESYCAKPAAGKLLLSPAEEDLMEPHDVWPDDAAIAAGLARFARAAALPALRGERRWAALRTYAPDRRPVVGFAPGPRRFLWLAGQGDAAVQTAPALSRHAADLCLGRPSALAAATVAAMDPGRFAASVANECS